MIADVKTQHTEPYLAAFERLERDSRRDPAWLRNVRREAVTRFAERGFPTTREEEWRFTPVSPITETRFDMEAEGESFDRRRLEGIRLADAIELVFVNGRYVPGLSSGAARADGVRLDSLANAIAADAGAVERHLTRVAGADHQPFLALNTAFVRDGAFVFVPAGQVLDRPIHMVIASAPDGRATVSHPRTLIIAGDGAQATIVETFIGDRVYFTNAVTEVVVGENAVVDHYKIQREDASAFHIGSVHARLDRSAVFLTHSVSLGGRLVRNDVIARLEGEGIDCTVNGLYLVDGQRLVDNHTTIHHAKPHGGSHELYKGILSEQGRAVFNGKIVVHPDAQKTDAKQTNKALLLSDEARIDTKPQLEIFADDVKCTHGAAIGQLEEEAVFYLRSRGIGEREARNLLIFAFANDIVSQMRSEPVKAALVTALHECLPHL